MIDVIIVKPANDNPIVLRAGTIHYAPYNYETVARGIGFKQGVWGNKGKEWALATASMVLKFKTNS